MFMTDLNSELSRCLGRSYTFSLAQEAAKETIPRKASSELNNQGRSQEKIRTEAMSMVEFPT